MAQKDEQGESEAGAVEGVGLTAESHGQMEQFRVTHETKVLTILLSDLEESTKQQAQLGNVRAAKLIQAHRSIFRTVLQDFDGQEIHAAGDSFLVVFAAPSEGVKFALHMQAAMRKAREEEPEFPWARVGIHQGQVVVERDAPGANVREIYGLQVSTAARITELAGGGQILCSRAVFDDASLKKQDSTCLKDFNGKKTWFLQLNPESIREVVFGLYTEKSLKSAIRKLIEQPELKHVKLYQAEESETYTLNLK